MLIEILFIIAIIGFIIYSLVPTYFYKIIDYKYKKNSSKNIFLTFDDGPSKYTNSLLDLLKKYDVKATFFIVSNFALQNEQIIKRMIDEEHLIGLHSFNHKNALFQFPTSTILDFKKSFDIVSNLKIEINYFRPSWGHLNLCSLIQIKKYKYSLFFWNVMVGDWKAKITSDIIAQRLLKKIKSGSVICLHDGRGSNEAPKRTIEALEKVIPILLEKGYIFEKVDLYEK